MIKCKVCDTEFAPVIGEHYISRDCGEAGIASVFRHDEEKLYDSFDCPHCGCQCIAQERKRVYVYPRIKVEVEEENEACEEAEDCDGEDKSS